MCPQILDTDPEKATIALYDQGAEAEIRATDRIRFPFAVTAVFGKLRPALGDDPLMLDVGCGGGRAIPHFRGLGITRYIGVDPAPGMLRIATQRYPGVDFRLGRAQDLSKIVSERCDAFVAVGSLDHILRRSMPTALENIRAVSRVGAVGCIAVPEENKRYRLQQSPYLIVPWKKSTLPPLLNKTGFRVVDMLRVRYDNEVDSLLLSVIAR